MPGTFQKSVYVNMDSSGFENWWHMLPEITFDSYIACVCVCVCVCVFVCVHVCITYYIYTFSSLIIANLHTYSAVVIDS